jgi:hypothetical protein
MTVDVADQPLEPFGPASFPAQPKLECDIVMKGGITSGVIYPLAVCDLAKVYRLRSVGGASAGAIAAAAATAAEVGRATVAAAASGATNAMPVDAAGVGFMGLANLPDELTEEQPGGKSRLFHLFRPQRSAKRLFGLLVAGMDAAADLRQLRRRFAGPRLAANLIAAGAWAFPVRAALAHGAGDPTRLAAALAGVDVLLTATTPATAGPIVEDVEMQHNGRSLDTFETFIRYTSILGALRNAYGQNEVDEAFTFLERSFSDCTSYTFELQAYDVAGRYGLYRRPRARLEFLRRSAAQFHLAGHPGVSPRGRRMEGSPSACRHRDRVTVPDYIRYSAKSGTSDHAHGCNFPDRLHGQRPVP